MYEHIRDGKSERDCIAEYPGLHFRYPAGIGKVRLVLDEPRDFGTAARAVVIYGESGVGKTHFAHRTMPDGYWLTTYSGRSSVTWFDNYHGESQIIIDEFTGNIRFAELLGLIDSRPLLVQRKGDSVQFKGKDFLILSNFHPNRWYRYVDYDGEERLCKAALQRRVIVYRRIKRGLIYMNIHEEWTG